MRGTDLEWLCTRCPQCEREVGAGAHRCGHCREALCCCEHCKAIVMQKWILPEHRCPVCLNPIMPSRSLPWAQDGGNMTRSGGNWSRQGELKGGKTVQLDDLPLHLVASHTHVYCLDVGGTVTSIEPDGTSRRLATTSLPRHARAAEFGSGLVIYRDALWRTTEGSIIAIDCATGQGRGEMSVGGKIVMGPFLGPRHGIYVVAESDGGYGMVRAEMKGRQKEWLPAVLDAPATNCTATLDGIVYGDVNGVVSFVEAATGEVRWRVETDIRILYPPTISNGVAAVSGFRQPIAAIDIETGELLWSRKTDLGCGVAPTARGDLLYCVTFAGRLIGLNLHQGFEQIQPQMNMIPVHARPNIGSEQIVLGSREARMYLFDLRTGLDLAGGPWPTGSAVVTTPVVSRDFLAFGLAHNQVRIQRHSVSAANDTDEGSVRDEQ